MKTEIPVRKVSQRVKPRTTPPAGWRNTKQRMTAMMFAPVAAMLGMLKPGGKFPHSDTSKGSK